MVRRAAVGIAHAAGWTVPAPDAEGVFTFRLAGGLRLEVFSPDGRTVILRGGVRLLPEDETEAEALLEKALRLAAAAGARRRSILSLAVPDPDADPPMRKSRLILHRIPRPAEYADTPAEELYAEEARGLLNDLVWWRGQLCDMPPVPLNALFPGTFPCAALPDI